VELSHWLSFTLIAGAIQLLGGVTWANDEISPAAQSFAVGLPPLMLTTLILGFVVHRVRRQKAQTESRQEHATALHTNRVEVFGLLAGALAHEINAPLAAIMNDARAAQHFLEASGPELGEARECIAAIETNAQRARDVILRMRSALRRQPGARSLQDLSGIVRESVLLMRHEAHDRGAEFELALEKRPLPVEVDAVQIQQVLLNLLLNALEATAEQPPERRRGAVRTYASGSSAVAEVMDRGGGVPSKHWAHIFEPFYTTKATGLGMGLSISRSIAELHGGRILMESTEGVGSVFRLIVPLAERTTLAPRESKHDSR
jgi:signal transduction histidine kinase